MFNDKKRQNETNRSNRTRFRINTFGHVRFQSNIFLLNFLSTIFEKSNEKWSSSCSSCCGFLCCRNLSTNQRKYPSILQCFYHWFWNFRIHFRTIRHVSIRIWFLFLMSHQRKRNDYSAKKKKTHFPWWFVIVFDPTKSIHRRGRSSSSSFSFFLSKLDDENDHREKKLSFSSNQRKTNVVVRWKHYRSIFQLYEIISVIFKSMKNKFQFFIGKSSTFLLFIFFFVEIFPFRLDTNRQFIILTSRLI